MTRSSPVRDRENATFPLPAFPAHPAWRLVIAIPFISTLAVGIWCSGALDSCLRDAQRISRYFVSPAGECTKQRGVCTLTDCHCKDGLVKRELVTEAGTPCAQCITRFCPVMVESCGSACTSEQCECEDYMWARVDVNNGSGEPCWQCKPATFDLTLQVGDASNQRCLADLGGDAAASLRGGLLRTSSHSGECTVFRYDGARLVDKRHGQRCLAWRPFGEFWGLVECADISEAAGQPAFFQRVLPDFGGVSNGMTNGSPVEVDGELEDAELAPAPRPVDVFCSGRRCVEAGERLCSSDPGRCTEEVCRCENPAWQLQELQTLSRLRCFACAPPPRICTSSPMSCTLGPCQCTDAAYERVAASRGNSASIGDDEEERRDLPNSSFPECFRCQPSSPRSFATTCIHASLCVLCGLVVGMAIPALFDLSFKTAHVGGIGDRAGGFGALPRQGGADRRRGVADTRSRCALTSRALAAVFASYHGGVLWLRDSLGALIAHVDGRFSAACTAEDAAQSRSTLANSSEADRPAISEEDLEADRSMSGPANIDRDPLGLTPPEVAEAQGDDSVPSFGNLDWDPIGFLPPSATETSASCHARGIPLVAADALPVETLLKCLPFLGASGQLSSLPRRGRVEHAVGTSPTGSADPARRRAARLLKLRQNRLVAANDAMAGKTAHRADELETTCVDDSWIDAMEKEEEQAKQRQSGTSRSGRKKVPCGGGGVATATARATESEAPATVPATAAPPPSKPARRTRARQRNTATGDEMAVASLQAETTIAAFQPEDFAAATAVQPMPVEPSADATANSITVGAMAAAPLATRAQQEAPGAPTETDQPAAMPASAATHKAADVFEKVSSADSDPVASSALVSTHDPSEADAIGLEEEAEADVGEDAEEEGTLGTELLLAQAVHDVFLLLTADHYFSIFPEGAPEQCAAGLESSAAPAPVCGIGSGPDFQTSFGLLNASGITSGLDLAAGLAPTSGAVSAPSSPPTKDIDFGSDGCGTTTPPASDGAATKGFGGSMLCEDALVFVPMAQMLQASEATGTYSSGYIGAPEGVPIAAVVCVTSAGDATEDFRTQPNAWPVVSPAVAFVPPSAFYGNFVEAEETVTTVMITGIHHNDSTDGFRKRLDDWGLAGTYDLLFLSEADGRTGPRTAFVNFTDARFVSLCCWLFKESQSDGTVSAAPVQGFEDNLAHCSRLAANARESGGVVPILVPSPKPCEWALWAVETLLSAPQTGYAPMPNVASGPPARGQYLKTKMCGYYKKGVCRFGTDCPYAHSKRELLPSPDLAKTRLCCPFLRGKCTYAKCKFAHGYKELRSTDKFYKTEMCRWFPSGTCRAGEQCRYAHDAGELRSPPGAMMPANVGDVFWAFEPQLTSDSVSAAAHERVADPAPGTMEAANLDDVFWAFEPQLTPDALSFAAHEQAAAAARAHALAACNGIPAQDRPSPADNGEVANPQTVWLPHEHDAHIWDIDDGSILRQRNTFMEVAYKFRDPAARRSYSCSDLADLVEVMEGEMVFTPRRRQEDRDAQGEDDGGEGPRAVFAAEEDQHDQEGHGGKDEGVECVRFLAPRARGTAAV